MNDDPTGLLFKLFTQEVPEIASGEVEIKAAARRPGFRSKVAVASQHPEIDCVGVCVGERGCRIKKIVDQLDRERIDIIRWTDSPEQMIPNALQPAMIERVVLHPERHMAIVVVHADQVSLVEGRQGLNRALASRLCGWEIQVKVQDDPEAAE
jgi:N utilization substance protein A